MAGTGDYFSIDAILCEETSVPVKFKCPLSKGLANILDAPADSTEEVKELPFWLAKGLDYNEYVEASVPKSYSKSTLSKLKVNASNQSLGQLSPFYYDFGVNLSQMMMDPELVQSLMVAFAKRYRDILDRFQNTEHRNSGKFLRTLTVEERKIYCAGQSSSIHHRLWKCRKLQRIEHAPIVKMSKRQRRE